MNKIKHLDLFGLNLTYSILTLIVLVVVTGFLPVKTYVMPVVILFAAPLFACLNRGLENSKYIILFSLTVLVLMAGFSIFRGVNIGYPSTSITVYTFFLLVGTVTLMKNRSFTKAFTTSFFCVFIASELWEIGIQAKHLLWHGFPVWAMDHLWIIPPIIFAFLYLRKQTKIKITGKMLMLIIAALDFSLIVGLYETVELGVVVKAFWCVTLLYIVTQNTRFQTIRAIIPTKKLG